MLQAAKRAQLAEAKAQLEKLRAGLGIDASASTSSGQVSFAADTDTGPKRRVQRRQTGVFSPPSSVAGAGPGSGGVTFASETDTSTKRPIVRQLTSGHELSQGLLQRTTSDAIIAEAQALIAVSQTAISLRRRFSICQRLSAVLISTAPQ
eukprot:SAG25_NODE_197_length_12126_cov_39.030515_21_plen_150_part_00